MMILDFLTPGKHLISAFIQEERVRLACELKRCSGADDYFTVIANSEPGAGYEASRLSSRDKEAAMQWRRPASNLTQEPELCPLPPLQKVGFGGGPTGPGSSSRRPGSCCKHADALCRVHATQGLCRRITLSAAPAPLLLC